MLVCTCNVIARHSVSPLRFSSRGNHVTNPAPSFRNGIATPRLASRLSSTGTKLVFLLVLSLRGETSPILFLSLLLSLPAVGEVFVPGNHPGRLKKKKTTCERNTLEVTKKKGAPRLVSRVNGV